MGSSVVKPQTIHANGQSVGGLPLDRSAATPEVLTLATRQNPHHPRPEVLTLKDTTTPHHRQSSYEVLTLNMACQNAGHRQNVVYIGILKSIK